MKHTEHQRMYAEVFGLDVSLTQSQPTESTQGTHRTLSAPRRSTRLTPPTPMPTVDKTDEIILQDTLQVSLAEHKNQEEQEARENMELVNKYLASEEIEKMILSTRLETRSDKESPEVESTNDEEMEVTNVVIPVNVNEEEDEITDEVYELKRREKGKIVEESKSTPFPTPIRSPKTHTNLRFLSRKSFDTLADHLQEVMVESLPTIVDTHIKEQVKKQVPEQVRDQVPVTTVIKVSFHEKQSSVAATRIAKAWHFKMKFKNLMYHKQHVDLQLPFASQDNRDDPHYDANPEGENMQSGKKTSEFKAYSVWRVIVWTINEEERGPSKIQVSLTIDEQKIKENADEMLRQRLVPDYAETGLLWSLSVFIRSSVIWERVHDFHLGIESYQQKVNLTAPTISFPGVEKHKMFSIIYEPVHRIIYKNSKKEKRVMRHSEIHKFCDVMLNRVLEGLKSYNNDVKYGYVQRELTIDEVEYLKLFEEEIKVRLKYRNQIRRWEMYVNGRPLGPQRERPE
ncbi:hypothetical protein Tco_1190417 [Tanacetum coccineum]